MCIKSRRLTQLALFNSTISRYVTAIDLLAARDEEPAKSIPYRSNLGGVYHRTKRFEKAIETFNSALAIVPNDAR